MFNKLVLILVLIVLTITSTLAMDPIRIAGQSSSATVKSDAFELTLRVYDAANDQIGSDFSVGFIDFDDMGVFSFVWSDPSLVYNPIYTIKISLTSNGLVIFESRLDKIVIAQSPFGALITPDQIDFSGEFNFSGDLNVEGTFALNGDEGTAGQILTSQGPGNTPIWTTISPVNEDLTDGAGITGGVYNGTAPITFNVDVDGTTLGFDSEGIDGKLQVNQGNNFDWTGTNTWGGTSSFNGTVNIGSTETPVDFIVNANSWSVDVDGNAIFDGTVTATNITGTNSGDLTLGEANGLSLDGQVLSLGLASATSFGALSDTDWSMFNAKQNALTAGDGISLFNDVITNTMPDQVVTLAGEGITVITGEYPNFTITSTEVDGSVSNELITATSWDDETNTLRITEAGVNWDTEITGFEPTLLKGDLTTTTWGVTITGGTGAVLGEGTSVDIATANFETTGLLTDADWNTFNNKQDALGYTPEDIANKVTSIDEFSTDVQYPSAKLLFDQLALKADVGTPDLQGAFNNSVNSAPYISPINGINFGNGKIMDVTGSKFKVVRERTEAGNIGSAMNAVVSNPDAGNSAFAASIQDVNYEDPTFTPGEEFSAIEGKLAEESGSWFGLLGVAVNMGGDIAPIYLKAGVLGTTPGRQIAGALGVTIGEVEYAGYFQGNVNVTGDVTATTFIGDLNGNAATADVADKVANALTAGEGLTGGTFDGSAEATFAVDEAYNYDWTGNNTWAGSSDFNADVHLNNDYLKIYNEAQALIVDAGPGHLDEGYFETYNADGSHRLVTIGASEDGENGSVSVYDATTMRAGMGNLNGMWSVGVLGDGYAAGALTTGGTDAKVMVTDGTNEVAMALGSIRAAASPVLYVKEGTSNFNFTVDLSGNTYIAGTLNVDLGTRLNATLEVAGTSTMQDVVPFETDLYDLGKEDNVWANVYATTLYGELIGNAATADVADKVANALTAGEGLTGGTFDGSAEATFAVDEAYNYDWTGTHTF
ncbi:MAG: hypothetical protein WCR42_09085, partial [bacterium]